MFTTLTAISKTTNPATLKYSHMDNTAPLPTASASISADTSKVSLMRSAAAEAKERGALVSLNAEDVLRVLHSNTELLDALKDAEQTIFRYALADAHKWTGDTSGEKALAHANSAVADIRSAIDKATAQ